MRAGIKVLIPLVGIVGALLLPASSQAAVTIGSDLSADANGSFGCGACTLSNRGITAGRAASGGFLAPSDGVIVRWRVKSGAGVAPFSLRVLRPGSSDTRASIATSIERTPIANTISTFAERLPVKAGDVLGMRKLTIEQADNFNIDSGAVNPPTLRFDGPNELVDGGEAKTGATSGPYELLVNADIEPDVDGDGFGDETQDLCPQDRALQVACGVVSVDVTGDGVIRGAGIDCPGDCRETYLAGDTAVLRAFSGEGSRFDGFGAPCARQSSCTFAVTADTATTATFVEDDPPETTITRKPKKSGTKQNVTIGFASDEPGATFECKLDSGAYKVCLSPYRLRVNPGKHTFTIRAIDAAGNVDETPAFTNFRVKKKPKRN